MVSATPPAGRQDTPAGYHGVKTVSCSGRVVPARLRYAPLEALPPPQVRDSTDTPPMWVCVDRNATTGHAYWKISLRGCTRCDTLATPSPLQVFPSICQGTKCGTPFNLLFHSLFVPNLAVQAMQGESPGNRPRAMGIFKGSSEQGRRRCSRARAALRPHAAPSPVERPLRVVPPFGPVYYTISSTLRHIPRSGEPNWGGRDD